MAATPAAARVLVAGSLLFAVVIESKGDGKKIEEVNAGGRALTASEATTTVTSTTSTVTSTTTALFAVRSSMSFESTGAQSDVEDAVTTYLVSALGVQSDDVTVTVGQAALRVTDGWDVALEVLAGPATVGSLYEATMTMANDTAATTSALAESFAASGLVLDEESFDMTEPSIWWVTATDTETSITSATSTSTTPYTSTSSSPTTSSMTTSSMTTMTTSSMTTSSMTTSTPAPAPTPAPSPAPTSAPTPAPTPAPTQAPASAPTTTEDTSSSTATDDEASTADGGGGDNLIIIVVAAIAILAAGPERELVN